ncbi:MAG: serine hydrolase [Gemmatimonadetes bacterium]|nr:serine hydrolase [Gemmatimonadota bacterium]
MSTLARGLAAALLLAIPAGRSLAQDRIDYHPFTRALTARGAQALHTCNGLFVSHRTLEQIYAGELRAAGGEPLPPGRVEIDRTRQTVAVGVGADDGIPVMRAALRQGLGCVVMAPNQTFDEVDQLPALRTPPLPGNPDAIAWPNGDLVPKKPLPAGVSGPALDAAGRWAFDRVANGGHAGQVTLSLLVVYRGDIVFERYADGVDYRTRTRTWSAAKSIAGTLIGIAVGRGMLKLDEPLPIAWPPDELNELHMRHRTRMPMVTLEPWPPVNRTPVADPRRRIALRHVLNMSSGLYPVDNQYGGSIGSGLSYFGGWNSAYQAADRGLVREPGTMWDYENYDTLLGMLALKTVIGNDSAYLTYPRRELFDKIGMRNTVPGVDRFGNFVLSSQVYTNARDLARLALLYLNRGVWNGERILPESWVDFSRTAAPSTAPFGNFYGAQWWLVQDARTDVPQDAYTMAGAQGQYAIVVPSHDLVIVRRGLDGGAPGFPTWDLVAQVLKALPTGRPAQKLVAAAGRE